MDDNDIAVIEKDELFFCKLKILEYLDIRGEIQNICKAFKQQVNKQNSMVYSFLVSVNPVDITEKNAYLGNLLLNEPVRCTQIFQLVLFEIITNLSLSHEEISLSQVSAELKYECVPSIKNIYHVSGVHDLSLKFTYTSVVQITGIIIGITALSKYTQSTKYICPNDYCSGHTGNDFIRVHIPGASETQTIRNDFSCPNCKALLEEDRSHRSLADKIIADLVPESCFRASNEQFERCQAIPVYFRGYLTKDVHIGMKCKIIGFVRKDAQNDKFVFSIEANNVLEGDSVIMSLNPVSLPKSIRQLYEDRRHSAWSFPLSLAYLFADKITPPGTFLKFKLGLLMSLVTVMDFKRKNLKEPVNLLAVGKETSFLHRLMLYSQKYIDRTVKHNAGNEFLGKVTTDKYKSAAYFVEGGSLLLSEDGICYIGDLSRLKKCTKEKLQSALTNRKVQLDIGSKFTGGLPQQIVSPLKCQIWAYTDPMAHKKAQHFDDLFTHCDVGDISKAILDSIGMVYYTDGTDNAGSEFLYHQLMNFTLLSSANEELGENPVSENDFREFFRYIDELSPTMTEEAEQLLNAYYVSSRRARSFGNGSSSVPASAQSTLSGISFAFAKLNLKTDVTVHDALMAIKLYEESLTARFGLSILSVLPQPHVINIEEFLGEENDRNMKQFHVNLLRFCSNQGGSYFHEE